ncbi:MAG: phosphate acyltransferase PlsX [Kiritimatiellae bacterium]|nr:phosphate acyltransferase PlsX [Kiritimatiellia bacterium]MDW8458309.1 phosphate acyltransferase PlsX [Verrucomicrobiota bacterium]
MRIAVDAMGGDYAPAAIVEGAVRAARELKSISELILVGDESRIREELRRHGETPHTIRIRHCTEVVEMGETPAVAVRKKKDSSINRAVDLVKEGEADAIFSAGSTGAQVAASMLKLRTLEGVQRPAIATVFPSPTKPFVLLDAGANTDCTPDMLLEFAVMGMVYSREILKARNPRIGLMSIGEEDAKGNATTKEAFRLLESSGLNFAGNIEGHDLFEGEIDVVVCDGFVGNVILKTSESVAHAMSVWLKQAFKANPIRMFGALCLRGALIGLKQKTDPAQYGGAPLLGVRGVSIIGHGSSNATAVFNGIRVSGEAVKQDINHLITEEISRVKQRVSPGVKNG